jgi:hypothetical protein
MALPQRKYDTGQSPNTYQYQVRNAKKVDRKGLNTDFQYLNDPEFSDSRNADPRLLSSANPTQRAQAERSTRPAANAETFDHVIHHKPITLARAKEQFNKKQLLLRGTKKLLIRTRVTTVSISIFWWGIWLWAAQAFTALIGSIYLGVLGASDAVVSSNIVTSAFGWLVNRAVEGGTLLITGTAISLNDMSTAVFMVLWTVPFTLGMVTLLVASIQYTMSLIHPLSGDNAGMKYVAYIIAIFGYSVPLLNLLPWYLIVIRVVWKYPK